MYRPGAISVVPHVNEFCHLLNRSIPIHPSCGALLEGKSPINEIWLNVASKSSRDFNALNNRKSYLCGLISSASISATYSHVDKLYARFNANPCPDRNSLLLSNFLRIILCLFPLQYFRTIRSYVSSFPLPPPPTVQTLPQITLHLVRVEIISDVLFFLLLVFRQFPLPAFSFFSVSYARLHTPILSKLPSVLESSTTISNRTFSCANKHSKHEVKCGKALCTGSNTDTSNWPLSSESSSFFSKSFLFLLFMLFFVVVIAMFNAAFGEKK